MPHQCTTCGRSFEDGSKEMLSGCPDCGGNKFQFQPAGAANSGGASAGNKAGGGAASAATAPKKTPENARKSAAEIPKTDATDAPETEGDGRASAVNRAAATVRDWVGKRNDTRDDRANRGQSSSSASDSVSSAGDSSPNAEDSAQASARRDVVSESELPDEPPQSTAPTATAEPEDNAPAQNPEANVVDTPDDQSPGLKELREELNSQFESIRIVEPGQYELNLMELYEREEYIISLQEDGKYVIEVPDAWDASTQ